MRAAIYFVIGLIVTPVLTIFLGWVLFGARSTWSVGQGDSFLVFIVALWTTPFGAVYWALMPFVVDSLPQTVPARRVLWIALALYLAGIVVALLGTDRAYV